MNPSVEGVVGLDDEAASKLSLEADVELIAFGDAYVRADAPREARLSRAELSHEGRVRRESFGEAQVRGDEGAALGDWQVVRVELDDRLAEREVVNRSQKCSVVEEARAEAKDCLAGFER